MLQQLQQKVVAQMVNQRIDIPLVPETQEGFMLEHAMSMVDGVLGDVLPDLFAQYATDPTQGIEPEQAPSFSKRLVQALNPRLDIPYLTEEQEARFLGLVIDILVESMVKGNSLPTTLPPEQNLTGSTR